MSTEQHANVSDDPYDLRVSQQFGSVRQPQESTKHASSVNNPNAPNTGLIPRTSTTVTLPDGTQQSQRQYASLPHFGAPNPNQSHPQHYTGDLPPSNQGPYAGILPTGYTHPISSSSNSNSHQPPSTTSGSNSHSLPQQASPLSADTTTWHCWRCAFTTPTHQLLTQHLDKTHGLGGDILGWEPEKGKVYWDGWSRFVTEEERQQQMQGGQRLGGGSYGGLTGGERRTGMVGETQQRTGFRSGSGMQGLMGEMYQHQHQQQQQQHQQQEQEQEQEQPAPAPAPAHYRITITQSGLEKPHTLKSSLHLSNHAHLRPSGKKKEEKKAARNL